LGERSPDVETVDQDRQGADAQHPAPRRGHTTEPSETQAEEKLLMGDRWPMKWQDLVFVTQNGTPLSSANARRMVRNMAAEAGIDGRVTPYDLRHSATSLLSEVGVPPEMLADLLGHVDTRMVHRFYRHPVSPTIRVAAEHIDTALDL
jgi:integrase